MRASDRGWLKINQRLEICLLNSLPQFLKNSLSPHNDRCFLDNDSEEHKVHVSIMYCHKLPTVSNLNNIHLLFYGFFWSGVW